MVNIIGLMGDAMLVNGRRTRCMVEVCLLGSMVDCTMENTWTTRNMDGENSVGLMGGVIQVIGLMGNSMGVAPTSAPKVRL